MLFYVMRHAHALPLNSAGVESDEERPLSSKGHLQIDQLAEACQQRTIRFSKILVSPFLRCVESAERLCKQMDLSTDCIIPCEEIAPGISKKKLKKKILAYEQDNLAIIGHEPDMGFFTAWIIGHKQAQIRFSKGSIACLDYSGPIQKGCAVLRWLVTPDWYISKSLQQSV